MIIQEPIPDTDLIKSYSDLNVLMLQVETGAMYGEAVDVLPLRYTYQETDIPIDPEDEEEASSEDYDEALRRLGVEV